MHRIALLWFHQPSVQIMLHKRTKGNWNKLHLKSIGWSINWKKPQNNRGCLISVETLIKNVPPCIRLKLVIVSRCFSNAWFLHSPCLSWHIIPNMRHFQFFFCAAGDKTKTQPNYRREKGCWSHFPLYSLKWNNNGKGQDILIFNFPPHKFRKNVLSAVLHQ